MDSCGPLLATHFLLEKQVEVIAIALWHRDPDSRGKKGAFFRKNIADRLRPAHRRRGFSWTTGPESTIS
jgi:hypothetical protein